MPRTFSPFLSLLVAVAALSGCADAEDDDRACPPRDTVARVTAIEGTTVRVHLMQSTQGPGEAVLHTDGARFLYYAGSLDACYPSSRSDLAVGQEIEFLAGAWMESFPPQANVDAIIILG